MGVGYSKAPPPSTWVIDFNFNVHYPTSTVVVYNELGPSSSAMDPDIIEEIMLSIEQVFRNCDEYNRSLYKKYSCMLCCCSLLLVPAMFIAPALGALLPLFWIRSDYYENYFLLTWIAVGVLVLATIIVCYCFCNASQRVQQTAVEWRKNIMQGIDERTSDWHDQWPQYAWTLHYPIIVGHKAKHIKGLLSVSVGESPQHVHSELPIYRQYAAAPEPPEPQIVMLQPAGVHGGAFMVQGQRAIMNGREVLVVQQPVVQQVHVPQPQPHYAASVHSAATSEVQIPAYQSVAASAPIDNYDHGDAHRVYPAVGAGAPYNPDAVAQPEVELQIASQSEGQAGHGHGDAQAATLSYQ